MRNLVALAPVLLAACGPGNTNAPTLSGEDIPSYFEFKSDALQHWEFINVDPAVSYKYNADQNAAVQTSDTGLIFTVNWDIECISNATTANDPCLDSAGAADIPAKSVEWEVDESKGVFIVGKNDQPSDPIVTFDPPIMLADGEMNPDDTVTTETNGFTFTSTYVGFDTCPVRWNVDWGDNCIKLTLDDGDTDPVTNEGLVGDYWAILGFNLVAFQTDTDSAVWQLSNHTCEGDGC